MNVKELKEILSRYTDNTTVIHMSRDDESNMQVAPVTMQSKIELYSPPHFSDKTTIARMTESKKVLAFGSIKHFIDDKCGFTIKIMPRHKNKKYIQCSFDAYMKEFGLEELK